MLGFHGLLLRSAIVSLSLLLGVPSAVTVGCGVCVAYEDATTMEAVKQKKMEPPSHHSGATPISKRQEVTVTAEQ